MATPSTAAGPGAAAAAPPQPPALLQNDCAESTGADHRDDNYELPTFSIFAGLSSLFLSNKFSDMTIVCGSVRFPAHRAIVCPRSPFFDKAMTIGFKETNTGVVELPEDYPDTVRRFLQFLYTGTYDDGVTPHFNEPSHAARMTPAEVEEELDTLPGVSITEGAQTTAPESQATPVPQPSGLHLWEEDQHGNDEDDPSYEVGSEDKEEPEEEYNTFGETRDSDDDDYRVLRSAHDDPAPPPEHAEMLAHARVYLIAHKYDVPFLRLLARDRFYRAAEVSYSTAPGFPEVLDEIYSWTPDTELAIREIVCRLVASGVSEDDEFRARIGPVMRKHADLAVDVLNFIVTRALLHW